MDTNILIIGVVVGLIVGVAVVQILMMSGFLWLASKGLKFSKQDFKTAFKTVSVYCTAMITLMVLCYIPSLITPMLSPSMGSVILLMPLVTLVMILLSCLIGVILMIYLIKKFYLVDWKNAFFAFVIVFLLNMVLSGLFYLLLIIPGVVLWQLGVFNAGATPVVTTGFEKLQPMAPSVAYEGGAYRTSFVNAVGTSINVTSVDVTEELSTVRCTDVTLMGEPVEAKSVNVAVKAGETVDVEATCPYKSEGDTFDVLVKIKYKATIGGITIGQEEDGRIRGPVTHES